MMAAETAYRKELREKILRTSMCEFRHKGIRRVKMDDVASLLSISKRTLYELFEDKESLLLEGVRLKNREEEMEMVRFAARPGVSVMDIIIEFYHWQTKALADVNPAFFEDLPRYGKVLAYIDEAHRRDQGSAREFFRKGVEEGYFRKDVDFDIVGRVANAAMQRVMEMKMYQEYDLNHLFRNIMFLFLRGFCTQKGLEILDAKMN